MPTLQKRPRNAGYFIRDDRQDPSISYDLTPEGERFMTIVMSLKENDAVRPADLSLLIDRGWAVPAAVEEPAAAPVELEPTPPIPSRPPSPPRKADPVRANAARRTRGREVALQILYQMEQNATSDIQQMNLFVQRRLSDDRLQDFARTLVAGVQEHQARLDELISGVAENWRIDRMAAIDRNILRLGVYEMLFCEDVPTKVAINEALELAKRYSTAQSSRFVNGILDRLQGASQEAPETSSEGAPSPDDIAPSAE